MLARVRVLVLLLLVCSAPCFSAVPEKPYGDLSSGDVLGATWLMGTFNTLYSWCQGASAAMDITNASFSAHAGSNAAHGCTSVASTSALTAHTSRTDNPHAVTHAQVGADAAGTAAAAAAAAQAAVQSNLNSHTGNTSNPHSVTAAQTGAWYSGNDGSGSGLDADLLDGNHAAAFESAGAAAGVQSNLNSHTGATAAHGATGAVVGTTNSQTLSYKTLDNTCSVYSATRLGGISGSADALPATVPIRDPSGNANFATLNLSLSNDGSTAADSYVIRDSSGWLRFRPLANVRGDIGANAYDITGFCPGTLPDSAVVFYLKAPRAFTLPINLTDSQAELLTATTGAKSFDIQKNGSSIGTISFGAGATAGTFTFASAVSFAAGDKLKIVGPATADGTLAGFSFALKGSY